VLPNVQASRGLFLPFRTLRPLIISKVELAPLLTPPPVRRLVLVLPD
jgi:hypothetical protein